MGFLQRNIFIDDELCGAYISSVSRRVCRAARGRRMDFGRRFVRTNPMVANFDNVQQIGKDQFEAVSAAAAAVTKGWQSIAAETTDYSKKSFEKSRLLAEKLITVKKIDEALALQSDFAKSAYEDFVAEATKIGELYTSMAKEVFKPIESVTKTFKAAE
jgi:hypothetical protein